jgi:hypothetical protein
MRRVRRSLRDHVGVVDLHGFRHVGHAGGIGPCVLTVTAAATANYAAVTTAVTQTLSIAVAAQTVAFTTSPPASAVYNTGFTVAATATSGLAVTFTSSGGCTNSGATYTMTSGTTACSVIASQPGNTNYAVATPATQSVTASLATQPTTITFTTSPPASAAYNGSFTVAATGGAGGNAVSFTSSGGCTNNGAIYTMTSGTTACSVMANQAANSNYAAGTQVTRSVSATLATQTIAFGAQSGLGFVGNAVLAPASATSGLAVTVTSTTTATCPVAGSAAVMLAAGTCTLQATQGGNANYSAAAPVSRSFAVVPAGASGSLTETTGSPFAVGTNPYFVAVGDFNGDGNLDIATANNDSGGSVTVLLGNGTGGFTAAPGSPFAVGTNPQSLAVGDFNGDGNLDIAAANFGSNSVLANGSVTVLLGNGTGGFAAAPGSPFTVGIWPTSVAVGDFNGDGNLDIATANRGSGNITVLLGNGTGGFTAAAGSPLTTAHGTSYSLAVGDFNGDGNLDIAASLYTGSNPSVAVLLGDGTGGFTAAAGSPYPAGAYPLSMAVGDFNGDGKLDIATANALNNTVTVLLGNATNIGGAFGFTAAPGSPFAVEVGIMSSPYSVAVGDFNGDGNLDIATANSGSDNVTVLLGTGTGGFTAAPLQFRAGNNPISVAVGDFNGDGKLDVATANPTGNNVTVLLGGLAATSASLSTTAASSIAYGIAVPLTLTVTPTADPFIATDPLGAFFGGTTTFYDGATAIGTATMTVSPYIFTPAAPLAPGSHTLTAGYGGDTRNLASTSGSVVVTVTQAAQAIAFTTGPPASEAYNGSFTVAATATSGLAVTFTSSGGCGNIGATYTMTSSATACSVIASQLGNTDYAAATQVTQAVSATVAVQTIAFAGAVPASAVFGSGAVTLTATSNAPSPAFTFGTTSASAICTVSGTSVTLVGAGTCVLTVTAAATGNYAAVTTPLTQTLTISPANPTVGFTTAPPSSAAFGSTFTVTATTNASSTVTFSVGTGGGCTISGATITMTSGTTSCVVTATSPADGNYVQGTTSRTTTATKIAPTVSFTGAPGSAAYQSGFTVTPSTNASTTAVVTSSGSCTNTANAVTMIGGTGACLLTATWAGDSNYNGTTASQSTTASKILPAVSFTGAPGTAAYGSTFTAASTTNASTTPSILAGGACSISGNTVTMTSGTGVCSLAASWAADSNYSPATATQTTTALMTAPVLPPTQTGTATYGVPTTLAVTVSPVSGEAIPTGTVSFQFTGAGNTVFYICANGTVQTVSCPVTLDGTGTATVTTSSLPTGTDGITATYSGDPNYSGSGQTALNFSISQANTQTGLTITPNSPAPTYGATLTLAATVADNSANSSGTPTGTAQFAFSLDGGVTWTNLGSPVTLNGSGAAQTQTSSLPAGTPMVRVTYSGDGNFNASTATVTQTVNPQTLTIAGITAQNKPYDGTTVATLNTSGETLAGVVNGDGISIARQPQSGTFTDANAGTGKTVNITGLTLAGTGAANYTLTPPAAAANIAQIAASVTPNAASAVYGQPDPAFSGTLSGFLAGDNVTATYTRTAGTTVGGSPYAISAVLSPAGILGNYTIAYNTANFTITQASATVTLSGLNPSYSGSATSVGVATTPASLSTSVTYNGSTAVPSASGSYAVVAVVTDPNYTGSASGTLTISQETLSVTSTPAGFGTVTYAGQNCLSVCTANYNGGTVITLTATPNTNYTFSGWSGACSGTGACSVTMNSAQSVTATFAVSGSTTLTAALGTKSGTSPTRVWPVVFTGTGPGTASNIIVTSFALTRTAGTACTPVVGTAMPVGAGTIAGAGTATANVTIDFTGCDGTSRFRLVMGYSANSGGIVNSATINNQFQ